MVSRTAATQRERQRQKQGQGQKQDKDKGEGEGELGAKSLRQKVLVVSLLAALLTTLLFVALASRN